MKFIRYFTVLFSLTALFMAACISITVGQYLPPIQVCSPIGGCALIVSGAITVHSDGSFASSSAKANSMCNLQGTAGSHNLTCTNAAGTVVCPTNTGADSCTMSATLYCGIISQDGSNQAGGVAMYDTTGTSTATNTELYVTTTTTVLQAGQIANMHSNCSSVTTGKILVTLTGGTTGANGDSLQYQ